MEKTKRLTTFLYIICYSLVVVGTVIAIAGCFVNSTAPTLISIAIFTIAALIGNKADNLKKQEETK